MATTFLNQLKNAFKIVLFQEFLGFDMAVKGKSARFEGVAIDVGGPLRISDIEMKFSEDLAFRNQFGRPIALTPLEAWQLYGVMSAERYVGFMKAALALERSGRGFEYFLKKSDPMAAMKRAIKKHISDAETEIIVRVATEAERHYNAHQSKRLANGATEALDLLKKHGVPFSVVSSLFTSKAIKWTDEMLPEYFKPGLVFGVEADTPDDYDPKPEQLKNSAKKMGIAVEKLLYVGDTRGDMKAAAGAGCSIALVKKGMTPSALFDKFLKEMRYFKKGKNFFIAEDLLDAVRALVINE